MDQTDHLVHTAGTDERVREEAHANYLEAWRAFHPAYVEALITAPRELLGATRAVRNTLFRLSWPTDAYLGALQTKQGRATLDEATWKDAHDQAEAARRDYMLAARRSFPDLEEVTELDMPTSAELAQG